MVEWEERILDFLLNRLPHSTYDLRWPPFCIDRKRGKSNQRALCPLETCFFIGT